MRLVGAFFGVARRNEGFKLNDPHPVTHTEDDISTGRPAHDGFTLLSRADPNRQGSPPPVHGTEGVVFRGPDESFEQ